MNTKSKRTVAVSPEVEAYNKQKPLTKAAVLKLQPGTFVEVRWIDAPNTVGLLTQKPTRERGSLSLSVFHQNSELNRWGTTDSDQIVAVHGQITWPEPQN